MDDDGAPLPSALSGDIEERLIRLDKSLFYLVAGALAWIADTQKYEQTGTLTVEQAREALSEMIWGFYTLSPIAPAGTILPFAGATLPDGYIACIGSVHLQIAYPKLFAAIGTTWNTGGEPSNAFRLPDLRGRAAIGAGTGSGLTNRVLGASGGVESHILTTGEMPAHAHSFGIRGADGAATDGRVPRSSDSATRVGTSSTDSAGGGGAHQNMQPFAVIQWMISTGEN